MPTYASSKFSSTQSSEAVGDGVGDGVCDDDALADDEGDVDAECDGGGNRGPKTLTVHIASCSGEGAPFARYAKLSMQSKPRSPLAPRPHKLAVRILCRVERTVCRVHALRKEDTCAKEEADTILCDTITGCTTSDSFSSP